MTIAFSNTVAITNVGGNPIEVQATGSDGRTVTARQVVYGYEVVGFHTIEPSQWRHDGNQCWFLQHFPDEHAYRYEGQDYWDWEAPGADCTWVAHGRSFDYSGATISGYDLAEDEPWEPQYWPLNDPGEVQYHLNHILNHVAHGMAVQHIMIVHLRTTAHADTV